MFIIMNLDELFNDLLNIDIPDQFCIDSGNQYYVSNLKFKDIFDHIKSKNWHNEGKHTTPHSESLYDHLINAGRLSYEKAVELGYNKKDCIKAWLTGLLHDVGKTGTQILKSQHITFKGHGIVGSAILDNFWSNNIETCFEINKQDWGDICTCTCVHMCGYFQDQKSVDHMFNFQILPHSVKKMLLPLRYGDQLSLVPQSWSPEYGTTKEILDLSEKEFIEHYLCEPNIVEYLNITNKNKGVVIQLLGTSCSGKTTFVNKLVNVFGSDKILHISRDEHMVKVICEKYNLKYEFNKETYQKCIKLYHESNKRDQSIINKNMNNECLFGITQGKIVIIDSLMTMYPNIISVLPISVKNSYKINIWFHRNKLITEADSSERLGMTLRDQIILYDDCNVYNPYRSGLIWSMLISNTENKIIDNTQIAKADLTLTVGWNFCNEHVFNHLYSIIDKIYDYNKQIPRIPDISETYDLNLLELVTKLHKISVLAIDEFFKQYSYIVSKPFTNVIGIKYIDGINNIWKPKWAREARGRFYYLDQNNVIELKYGLQRGIEILTKAHRDNGIINTQDIDETNVCESKFDDTQNMILNKFKGNNLFKSYISAKVDGSLIIINVYPKNCKQYNIINEIITNYGDDFSKDILNYCLENNLPIVTIATQGTLLLNEDMQDYFLSAIQDTYNIHILINTVVTFVNNIGDQYVALFFEAFCKNRTTNKGRLHVELAVGYEENGLQLLGAMHNNIYIPHFDLPNHTFTQPFYMEVNTTETVYYIMELLNKIVVNDVDISELLNLCSNKNTSKLLHPEGFVLLTPLENKIYDYAKIKTTMYYDCHKIKQNKITKILQLNENCEKYYPVIKKLKFFFNNLKSSVVELIELSYKRLIDEINISSPIIQSLNVKALQKINELINNNVIYKIVLNNRASFNNIIVLFEPIINKIFIEKSGTIDEFTNYIKKILMKIEPWSNNNWKNTLELMIDNYDSEISDLYYLVIGLTD